MPSVVVFCLLLSTSIPEMEKKRLGGEVKCCSGCGGGGGKRMIWCCCCCCCCFGSVIFRCYCGGRGSDCGGDSSGGDGVFL